MPAHTALQGDKIGLPLSDFLALERTHLANQRTLLSYCRTALAMMGAGTTLMLIYNDVWGLVVGSTLIVGGLAAFAIGIASFRDVRRRLNAKLS